MRLENATGEYDFARRQKSYIFLCEENEHQEANRASLTNPLDKTTGFGFDALNRLITAANPLMGVSNSG